MTYYFKDHTADIKYVVESDSIEDAFKESVNAFVDIILDDNRLKETTHEKNILVSGRDLKRLLYEFLEEILFYFDTELVLPKKVLKLEIRKNGKYNLKSNIIFSKVDKVNIGIKAITYHEMKIEKKGRKWFIESVLDI